MDGAAFNFSAEVFTDTPMLLHEVQRGATRRVLHALPLHVVHVLTVAPRRLLRAASMDVCIFKRSDPTSELPKVPVVVRQSLMLLHLCISLPHLTKLGTPAGGDAAEDRRL